MTEQQKKAELLSAAEAAAFAADFARTNIKKFLELHSGEHAHFVMKIAEGGAQFNMKIAEETKDKVAKIVEASAELAASNLQEFLKRQKGE